MEINAVNSIRVSPVNTENHAYHCAGVEFTVEVSYGDKPHDSVDVYARCLKCGIAAPMTVRMIH